MHAEWGLSIITNMNIHFVGIRGASMSVLAELERARGNVVTGSDLALGGHDAKNVEGCDLVVYTNAIKPDNPELVRAREKGIPTVERAQLLGSLAATYDNVIAVAGCHGKSTTTSMIGGVFSERDATVHVGAVGSRIGGRKYFITEACEYNKSFLYLHPTVGVVLNIEFDHPDCYKDTRVMEEAYKKFGEQCGTLVVNGDDPLCREVFQGKKNVISVGFGAHNDYRATCLTSEKGNRAFCVSHHGRKLGRASLIVPGEHNVHNALAAITVARIFGIDFETIAAHVNAFCGTPRRFQLIKKVNGADVICDYAHHPSEIAASLKTASEMYDTIAVVFQPHTYSRLASMENEFAAALLQANVVVVAPVFAAREKPLSQVSSHALCRKIIDLGGRAYAFDTFFSIDKFCKTLDVDAIIYMGAGDIDIACRNL